MNELQLASRMDQARAFVQDEKPLHAAQVYLRLIGSEPKFLPAYIELASVYAETGQVASAISLLQRARTIFPHDEQVVYTIGTLHLRMQEYDRAIAVFKELVGKKLPHVHFNLGIAYFYTSDIARAEEQFRLTLRYDPKFPKINESLGELLLKRGSYTEAIEYLKRGLAADPFSAVNHYLLGAAYGRIDQWKRAHEEFILAVDMDPTEAANWHACGESLLNLKRYTDAEPYLRKALEMAPNSVDALIDLGRVLSKLGKNDEARTCIEQAMAIDPGNARVDDARKSGGSTHHLNKKK